MCKTIVSYKIIVRLLKIIDCVNTYFILEIGMERSILIVVRNIDQYRIPILLGKFISTPDIICKPQNT